MITIKLIAITVVLVLGLKIALSEKMLLEKLGEFFERKVDEGYKYFDLLICPWCMPSLFSIVAHGFAFGLNIIPFEWNWQLLIRWPLIVMGASIIAGNFWNIYLMINQIKEKNEIESEYYKNFFYEENNESSN